MAVKTTSVLIGGVSTNDAWADQMYFVLWADSALSFPLASRTVGLKQSGSLKVQSESAVFDSLTIGNRYWLSVQTVVSSTGAASSATSYTLIAGNSSTPLVSYSYAKYATPAGYNIEVTPTLFPIDIDHYEYFITSESAAVPTPSTVPTGQATPSASGKFTFFAGSGPGLVAIYVRAVNTSSIVQGWVNLTTSPVSNQTKVLAKSVGQYAVSTYGFSSVIINDVNVTLPTPIEGFNMVLISPNSPYNIIGVFQYNLAAHPEQAVTMSNKIRQYQDGTIFVIVAAQETAGHRGEYVPLNDALYSLGASRVIWNGKYRICGAYILIGKWATGEGNGIELYAGAADLDPLAYCETVCYINDGKVLGYNGTYTPAFQVDPSQGDFAALGSIPASLSQAFTYTSTNSSIHWIWTTFNVFRVDLNNTVIEVGNGGLDITGLSSGVGYNFYPYLDDNYQSVNHGLVIFVNEVPGGAGVYNNAYLGIDFNCIQYTCRLDRVPLVNGAIQASTTGSSGVTGGGSDGGSGVCLREDVPVREKDRGLIRCIELRKGDFVEGPEGWVEVEEVSYDDNELWCGITFYGHEHEGEYATTLNHPWVLLDGTAKQSSSLSLSDQIPTKQGMTFPQSIRMFTEPGRKVRITVKSESRLYYIGQLGIQTHNMIAFDVC